MVAVRSAAFRRSRIMASMRIRIAPTALMLGLAIAMPIACESRRLFDPETLYTSPDSTQPWTPPGAMARAGGGFDDPSWLQRRLGDGRVAAPTAIATPSEPANSGAFADGGGDMARSDAGVADGNAAESAADPTVDRATLAQLVDYALRHNPTTRAQWERARAAEANLGVVESRYFPDLNAVGFGGQIQESSASTQGQEIVRGPTIGGALELNWVLLDFGRRDAASAAATHALFAANFDFNRTLQTVVYKVQRAYFDLDAKMALEQTARQNLDTSVTQSEAVDERLRVGLATLPDLLQSKQRVTKARFDFEAAKSDAINARAVLAREIGLPADAWISIEPLRDLPIPPGLEVGVDRLIEESVATRPDVRARFARVRVAEQRVREAQAAFAPIVSFDGKVGGSLIDYSVSNQPGPPLPPLSRRYDASLPDYLVGLRASWLLFDGFERDNALRLVQAERRAATAELESLRLEITGEVWSAYFDLRAARVQLKFGEALLNASQEAYDSVFQSYLQGLRTVTDLLQAESDLFGARSTLVRTRAELLSASVRLSYALGSDTR